MIIFGTRARHTTIDEGEFFCPQCQAKHHYEHKKAKRYFALYFIPIIPMDDLGKYIQCGTCHTMFKIDVLDAKFSKKPQSTAEQINTIGKRLHDGAPIELVVRDLTISGIDREVATKLVDAQIGLKRNTCRSCALTYTDNVTVCAECHQPLVTTS